MQKEKATKKEVNYQFRFLYCIGILAVVCGHAGGGGISLFFDWFKPQAYHLGLFAFVSGYFFVTNFSLKIFDVIKKKFQSFIIPMYLWNFFYGIIIIILHQFGIQFGSSFNFHNLFIQPLLNGHQFLLNLGAWFLVPLFFLQVLHALLLPFLRKGKKQIIIWLFLSIILGILGTQLAILGYRKSWWILLDHILYFLPYFSFGIFYRQVLEKKDTLNNYFYFAILFFLQLLVIYINGQVRGYIPLGFNGFDNFYMPYIVGFLGIAFWLRVSRILVPITKNSKLINLIGSNTFGIMMHHITGFFLLNCLWFLLSRKFSFLSGFQVTQFISTVYYMYLPKNLSQFKLLYVIFGVSFSLLFTLLTKWSCQQLRKKWIKIKANRF